MSVAFNNSGYNKTTALPNKDLFTFMSWFRRTGSNGTYGNIFSGYGTSGDLAAMGVGATGIDFQLGDNNADFPGGGNLTANQWYHCCWTRNGNADNVAYLDGVEAVASCTLVLTTVPGIKWSIGKESRFGTYPIGQVFNAKMWERVLSLAEIKNEMRRVRPWTTGSLYAEWDLLNTTQALVDSSGRGHHLDTTTGTPTSAASTVPPVTWSSVPPAMVTL